MVLRIFRGAHLGRLTVDWRLAVERKCVPMQCGAPFCVFAEHFHAAWRAHLSAPMRLHEASKTFYFTWFLTFLGGPTWGVWRLTVEHKCVPMQRGARFCDIVFRETLIFVRSDFANIYFCKVCFRQHLIFERSRLKQHYFWKGGYCPNLVFIMFGRVPGTKPKSCTRCDT